MAQRAYKDYDMATDPGEFYRLSWYGLRNTYWAAGKSIEDSNLAASQDLLGELGNYNAYIIPQGEYLVTPHGKLNPNVRVIMIRLPMPCSTMPSVKSTMYLHRVVMTAQITMYLWAFWTMTLMC